MKVMAFAADSLISWRMVDRILPSKEEFLEALSSGKRLRFYWGIDPTSPDVHLGHLANLWFLRDMQKLGHEIILVVGDFTARIGDPSGRDTARKPLSEKEVLKNAAAYRAQLSKVVSLERSKNPARIVFNSKWLSKLSLEEVLRVASHLTVEQLLERDMFERRMKRGEPVWLHEFIYPLLQGYDSLELEPDAEIGGEDQLFNMLIGRKLLEELKGKQKFVITTKLLINPATGKKLMSKSEGNYVSLQDSPNDMYAKVMAFPDEVVWQCLELTTDIPDNELQMLRSKAKQGKAMRDIKALLAERLVSIFYSDSQAKRAAENFRSVTKEELDEFEMGTLKVKPMEKAVDFVSRAKRFSKSHASRLIASGAIHLYERDSKRIVKVKSRDELIDFKKYRYVRIGKRKRENFYKIEVEE